MLRALSNCKSIATESTHFALPFLLNKLNKTNRAIFAVVSLEIQVEALQDHDCGAMMLVKRRVRKTKLKTKQNKEQPANFKIVHCKFNNF